MSTIIISEKNKAAIAIAEALGAVKIINKAKNVNVYQVQGKSHYYP